ncbi:hypothetical protein EJB05_44674, partial [Eragrostis curvula]
MEVSFRPKQFNRGSQQTWRGGNTTQATNQKELNAVSRPSPPPPVAVPCRRPHSHRRDEQQVRPLLSLRERRRFRLAPRSRLSFDWIGVQIHRDPDRLNPQSHAQGLVRPRFLLGLIAQ